MKAPGLPADQQFFADLFSGLVLNPQLLGRVWFASQPASLPVGSLCIDFPRLDIVLRGEYGNLLEAKQQRMVEGEMLFIPASARKKSPRKIWKQRSNSGSLTRPRRTVPVMNPV